MKNNPIIAMISQGLGLGNAIVLLLSSILTLFQQIAQYGTIVIVVAGLNYCERYI